MADVFVVKMRNVSGPHLKLLHKSGMGGKRGEGGRLGEGSAEKDRGWRR